MVVCKNCGEQLPDNMKFCTRCGTPVEREEKKKGKDSRKEHKKGSPTPEKKGVGYLFIWILALAIVFAVTSGLLYILLTGTFLGTEEIPEEQESSVEELREEEPIPEDDSVEMEIVVRENVSSSPKPSETAAPKPQYTPDSGIDIPYLQRVLVYLGEQNVQENGEYDYSTEQALLAQLPDREIIKNNCIDAKVVNALDEKLQGQRGLSPCTSTVKTKAELYPVPTEELKYDGSLPYKGEEIKYVQAALTEMNYTGITMNGIYDSATEDAVKRFQKAHSMNASGVVDTQTLNEITTALPQWRQRQAEATATPKPATTVPASTPVHTQPPTVQSTPTPTVEPAPSPSTAPQPVPASTDGYLTISQVSASSELYVDEIEEYPAECVCDQNLETAWQEGVDGYGVDEYLTFCMDPGTEITGFFIINGFSKSERLFYANGAVTKIKLVSGDQSCVVDITRSAETYSTTGYTYELDTPMVCDGILRVYIVEVREGENFDDSGFTELWFMGNTEGDGLMELPGEPETGESP